MLASTPLELGRLHSAVLISFADGALHLFVSSGTTNAAEPWKRMISSWLTRVRLFREQALFKCCLSELPKTGRLGTDMS